MENYAVAQLGGVLRDGGLELVEVRANNGLDLFAVLEEDKGGHRTDADLLRNLALLVDVDLVEAELLAGGGLGDLLEDRADHLARTAPGGPEVDHDDLVTAGNLLELVVRRDNLNTHGEFGEMEYEARHRTAFIAVQLANARSRKHTGKSITAHAPQKMNGAEHARSRADAILSGAWPPHRCGEMARARVRTVSKMLKKVRIGMLIQC